MEMMNFPLSTLKLLRYCKKRHHLNSRGDNVFLSSPWPGSAQVDWQTILFWKCTFSILYIFTCTQKVIVIVQKMQSTSKEKVWLETQTSHLIASVVLAKSRCLCPFIVWPVSRHGNVNNNIFVTRAVHVNNISFLLKPVLWVSSLPSWCPSWPRLTGSQGIFWALPASHLNPFISIFKLLSWEFVITRNF